MSWFRTGGMSYLVGKLNLKQLIGILNSSLLPTVDEVAKKLLNARYEVVFQQDNDPKHTSRATKD